MKESNESRVSGGVEGGGAEAVPKLGLVRFSITQAGPSQLTRHRRQLIYGRTCARFGRRCSAVSHRHEKSNLSVEYTCEPYTDQQNRFPTTHFCCDHCAQTSPVQAYTYRCTCIQTHKRCSSQSAFPTFPITPNGFPFENRLHLADCTHSII
jgi:hypothetical protein